MSEQAAGTAKPDDRTLTIATLVTKRHGLDELETAMSQRITGINPSIDVQVYAKLLDLRFEREALSLRLQHIEAGGPYHAPTLAQARAVTVAADAAETLIKGKAETLRLIAATDDLLKTFSAAASQA